MTNEDLYRVLAHTDPAYLEHSERTVRRGRRVLRTALAAAAVIAVLTCTAFAIPAVRNYITGLIPQQTNLATVTETPDGQTHAYAGSVDVYPEVAVAADAPEYIETYYVPLYLAEHWQPVTRELPGEPSEPSARRDIGLQWQSDSGIRVDFCQLTRFDENVEWCESIPTGYSNDYEISQTSYGGLDLWTVTVGPSQAEISEGILTFDGFQKFYWSDGQYFFTLRIDYGADDKLLERIFGSMTAVEDIAPYQNIEYVEPVTVTTETSEDVWFPTYIPEGYELEIGTIAAGLGRGYYEFYWFKELDNGTRTSIELYQAEYMEGTIWSWETTTVEHTKEVVTVGDWEVTIYSRELKTEALWKIEDCEYMLTSRGLEQLMPEELVKIIESLEVLEDPALYLTDR